MPKIIHKHPLATRWFHWLNFPILGVMIWSGLLIYWANGIYKIQFNGTIFFTFFPKDFYKALGVPYHLAEGMAYHFLFMWLFFLNGLLYVTYTIFSGEYKLLVPNKHSFKDAWEVLKHDLFITKNKT